MRLTMRTIARFIPRTTSTILRRRSPLYVWDSHACGPPCLRPPNRLWKLTRGRTLSWARSTPAPALTSQRQGFIRCVSCFTTGDQAVRWAAVAALRAEPRLYQISGSRYLPMLAKPLRSISTGSTLLTYAKQVSSANTRPLWSSQSL